MPPKKKTRGKQRIELKKIENDRDRNVTFSKRRSGIIKKAAELAILTGAEVGFLVFSPAGKPYTYGSPSFQHVIHRFMNTNVPPSDPVNRAPDDESNENYLEIYNEVQERYNAALEKEKALRQKMTKDKGKRPTGWWETPVNSLSDEGCLYVMQAYKKLIQDISAALGKKSMDVVSSSSRAGEAAAAADAAMAGGSFWQQHQQQPSPMQPSDQRMGGLHGTSSEQVPPPGQHTSFFQPPPQHKGDLHGAPSSHLPPLHHHMGGFHGASSSHSPPLHQHTSGFHGASSSHPLPLNQQMGDYGASFLQPPSLHQQTGVFYGTSSPQPSPLGQQMGNFHGASSLQPPPLNQHMSEFHGASSSHAPPLGQQMGEFHNTSFLNPSPIAQHMGHFPGTSTLQPPPLGQQMGDFRGTSYLQPSPLDQQMGNIHSTSSPQPSAFPSDQQPVNPYVDVEMIRNLLSSTSFNSSPQFEDPYGGEATAKNLNTNANYHTFRTNPLFEGSVGRNESKSSASSWHNSGFHDGDGSSLQTTTPSIPSFPGHRPWQANAFEAAPPVSFPFPAHGANAPPAFLQQVHGPFGGQGNAFHTASGAVPPFYGQNMFQNPTFHGGLGEPDSTVPEDMDVDSVPNLGEHRQK